MTEKPEEIHYLVFDVEAIADGTLISRIRYPDQQLSPDDAIARYRRELMDEKGNDVIPYTFMLPISVAVAKLDKKYKLCDLTVLDAPNFRAHEITRRFWQGWSHYQQPTFVTFNGRGYDLPVLELAAFRYGLNVAQWFTIDGRSYDQPRNRYNMDAHIDLMDLISNFGATRVTGGLNLLANLIGKPGKTGIDGSKIQDMYAAGKVAQINDYCRCDVLDTYFVFLRSRVLFGKMTLEEEHRLVLETKNWLEQQAESIPAYRDYLSHWGDWSPPE
ncbi:MAG: 3'-5' exonuclease [Planctomycetaceae bacterium]